MRGRDEDTGEFRGDSRSQQRRAALDVLSLGEKLVALTPAQLAKLPVPESLIPHIEESKRITSHIAHKRQLAFLAKQMRREDDAALDAIREAMDANSDGARREVAAIHRVEGWRARLLADGDSALSELLTEHPEAERQRLRQLIRNAKEERLKNKPPHAYRELFRELRELVLGADSGLGTRDSGLEAADLDALETDPDERD
ncbi:ribosome-associated protein [Xanthomonas translucens pv. undulosa]|uniref:ribosome biogenesis factor YjgA n=1 Tax=Xanthomonas campestris pv. translucens TaxID=343 RepID=UPI0019D69A46|nr:ribosome biogenesis factor YjgA [Xanthomonas translucens]QSQ41001.1 ribosome-associated protein [Xanthomonas translucens pv. translucens]QSQ47803.1 ribosome-associated protein [Xanthomonas translucens pv. undulosa]QSQ53505.1 ribosome-associated protein [Xanthomonas translucens pv. undulosa]QSQ60877.1 ribosome-associated protein [Xanthomonas translucens pv. undulosa]UPU48376.1 ribosome-associated protein [Xanthomonas translucens pv. undulosa]